MTAYTQQYVPHNLLPTLTWTRVAAITGAIVLLVAGFVLAMQTRTQSSPAPQPNVPMSTSPGVGP